MKNIKGFEEKYSITEDGKVWSKPNKFAKHNGKFIAISKRKDGYLMCNLYKYPKNIGKYIHRLVAEAYILNPDGKLEVNHIDCNKENNHYSNLEWATRKENVVHSFEVLGKEVASGKTHILSKAIVAIDDEGNIVEDFESAGQAQKSGKGYTTSNIARSIKNGTKHKGLLWKHK